MPQLKEFPTTTLPTGEGSESVYAFLSHESACEALRAMKGLAVPWPTTTRMLPIWGSCVCGQRGYKALRQKVNLEERGVMRRPVDVLVPSKSMRSRGKDVRAHVWTNAVPPNAFYRLCPQLLVSSPEFVMVQMAAQNFKTAKAIEDFADRLRTEEEMRAQVGIEGPVPYDDVFEWQRMERIVRMAVLACEFMGTYRLAVGSGETNYDASPLTSKGRVRDFADGLGRAYGANRLTEALEISYEGSASPMETALVLMLTLPVEMGGYGLPRPVLNCRKDTKEWGHVTGVRDGVKPDLLWDDARLVVEYDSDEFHQKKGSRSAAMDARHTNALVMMGYTVLRVTTTMIQTPRDCDLLAAQAASILGGDLVRPDEPLLMRRMRLRTLLLGQ